MSERLRKEDLFRQILEAAPNAIVTIDMAGRVEMVNAQAEFLFGRGRQEILGGSIERFVPEWFRGDYRGLPVALSAGPASSPVRMVRDLYAIHKDRGEFPIEILCNQIETEAGPKVVSAIVDISARKQNEQRVQAILKEKDILLGELHHRVKNNLQIVYSLLDLQLSRVSDPPTLELLRDSQDRVRSMALIHQTLHGSKDFETVDFGLFIGTLLPALIRSHTVDPGRITVRADVEPFQFPMDIAVPCGLMVNELVTNAFKHAFRDRGRGEIRLALTGQTATEAVLSVSDDGVGLPDHVDAATDSLGLRLVGLLADQIDGTFSINRSNPTRFSVRFPI